MTRDEILALVNAWSRAVSDRDLEMLGGLVAPSLREGVLARARAVHAAFRDVTVEPSQVVVEGDLVAWRWRLTGTHVGAIAGVAPSGATRALEGVNFQRMGEGVVTEHWTTVDLGPLSR